VHVGSRDTNGHGPARPNKASIAAAYNAKADGEAAKAGAADKKLRGQATLLTRVPSLRYRFHPYQRDDRVRQAAEEAEVDRVREALSRSPVFVCVGDDVCARTSSSRMLTRLLARTDPPGNPRYLTHIHWLEEVLAPARPGGAPSAGADEGSAAGASGGVGGVQVKAMGPEGKVMVFDDSTVAAQKVGAVASLNALMSC